MKRPSLESATLFTPGRSSYIDERGVLQLSDASLRRAYVASDAFNENFHTTAVFAGGFPGLAQNWAPELTPPADRREATLMAAFLTEKLAAKGFPSDVIDSIVHTEGESSNSFGDVIVSIEKGILDPNEFNTDTRHDLELTAGMLHGKRFSMILAKALDIDPTRIHRVAMHDIYGTPEYPLQPAEHATIAVGKEMAAIVLTGYVLRGVKSGDLDGIKDAEQRFKDIYKATIARK